MKKTALTLVISILTLSACQPTPAGEQKSLTVITSIAPLYSITTYLTEGTDTKVTNLVPPNATVHSYQLSPNDAKNLNNADLIVINGLELETFLESIIADLPGTVVNTSENVDLISLIEEEHDEDEEDHHHGAYDPHIWLSPINAEKQAANITQALMTADPENAELYEHNFKHLSGDLLLLDTQIHQRLSALDLQPYLVFHDAYQYFDQTYGVGPAAFIKESPSQEPTAEYLAEVISIIQESEIKVAFSEPQFSPKLLQTLSEDYGLTILELDPLGQTISKEGYFQLMESNISAFEAAFPKTTTDEDNS